MLTSNRSQVCIASGWERGQGSQHVYVLGVSIPSSSPVFGRLPPPSVTVPSSHSDPCICPVSSSEVPVITWCPSAYLSRIRPLIPSAESLVLWKVTSQLVKIPCRHPWKAFPHPPYPNKSHESH